MRLCRQIRRDKNNSVEECCQLSLRGTEGCSEREARREHPAGIVGMEACRGDLHSNRRRETQISAEADAPKAQARRKEYLLVTSIFPHLIKSRVHFELRPKLPEGAVLESGVPLKLPA